MDSKSIHKLEVFSAAAVIIGLSEISVLGQYWTEHGEGSTHDGQNIGPSNMAVSCIIGVWFRAAVMSHKAAIQAHWEHHKRNDEQDNCGRDRIFKMSLSSKRAQD